MDFNMVVLSGKLISTRFTKASSYEDTRCVLLVEVKADGERRYVDLYVEPILPLLNALGDIPMGVRVWAAATVQTRHRETRVFAADGKFTLSTEDGTFYAGSPATG